MNSSRKTVLYAKNFYLQQELRGIMDFARGHGWQLEIPQMYGLPGHVRNWRGAGLLTDTGYYTEKLHSEGVKIVGLSLDPKLVRNSDVSSGRITAVSGRPSPSITSRAVIGISRPAKMFTAGTMRLRRGSNARGSAPSALRCRAISVLRRR